MTEPRSEALKSARVKRMTAWFGSRRWRVCSELSFTNDDLIVQNGEFWVQGMKVFRTPFGNKGVHGYILQEIDPTGADVWDGDKLSRVPFGWVTIKHAADMFPGSIVEVPPRPYGRKPVMTDHRDDENGPPYPGAL